LLPSFTRFIAAATYIDFLVPSLRMLAALITTNVLLARYFITGLTGFLYWFLLLLAGILKRV